MVVADVDEVEVRSRAELEVVLAVAAADDEAVVP